MEIKSFIKKDIKFYFILILISLLLTSCKTENGNTKFNLDQIGVEYLMVDGNGNNWYVKNGEKHNIYKLSEIELKDINYKASRDMFFITDDLVVYVMYNKLFYYDINKDKIVKKLNFNNLINVSCGDDMGSVYIKESNILYKYNIENNNLNVITDNLPYPAFKIIYCKQRNSIFYDGYGNLYEFSLIDKKSVLKLEQSLLIEYLENEGKLYFYNWDKNQIEYANINDFERKKVFKKKSVYDFMIDRDIIWINTMDKSGDIILTDILIGKEVYIPFSQFLGKSSNEFKRIVDFRINDQLYKFLLLEENNKK